ncbi:MAG: YegS/Rv2252/BmrU family lipid kinase [Tissierellia bacterium]|nr:YegS/Rv2252/BmrU family lipid kinase [Tissierellia bacterium]
MKHIFIINPIAGKGNIQKEIINNINNLNLTHKEIEFEIYITKFKGDASNFVETKCKENIPYIFYACGGDGTLHEVINAACKYDHIVVGHIPCGTGNDFVRNFENKDNFNRIEEQIYGEAVYIDLIKVSDKYAASVCNIGLDADVAFNMHKFKRIPFVKGTASYILSILFCLFKKMGKNLTVQFEDGQVISGNYLLGVVANGNSYGGGYKCAPLASINDGILDICLVKKISRLKILNLLNVYKAGEHLNNEKISKYIFYKKNKNIKINSTSPIHLCIDGESYIYGDLEFKVIHNAIKFWVPRGTKIINFYSGTIL